jgi:hypothetical protein
MPPAPLWKPREVILTEPDVEQSVMTVPLAPYPAMPPALPAGLPLVSAVDEKSREAEESESLMAAFFIYPAIPPP